MLPSAGRQTGISHALTVEHSLEAMKEDSVSVETLSPRTTSTEAPTTTKAADWTQASLELTRLLRRSGDGDRAAFAELYRRTHSRLFGVIVRLHRDRTRAEDVLQEVYVNIWRAARTFDAAQGQPLTWLFTIARNRAIDSLRRAETEPRIQSTNAVAGPGEEDSFYDAITAPAPGPLELLSRSSEARALAACMDRLEPLHRESLQLAYFDGLSHAEVAARMGQPVGTIKSWIRRAMPMLKDCLCAAEARSLPSTTDLVRSSRSSFEMTSIARVPGKVVLAGGGPPGYSLDCLLARPRRPEDFRSESKVLAELASRMVDTPHAILKCLSDAAMQLTGAHSAGVSILESDEEGERFHWRATSGHFAEHLDGTMPGDRSPCGLVLQQRATLFMMDPVQYFPEVAQLCRPVREVLLAPFYRNGAPVGTVWVVSHTAEKRFDGEDARLLETVARFGSTAAQVASQREALEKTNRDMAKQFDERQRAEQQASRLHLALAASHEQQRFVLDALAHELRGPLGAMSNAFALLERETSPGTNPKTLGVMTRQLAHMGHLVAELAQASRVEDDPSPQERLPMRSIVRRAFETASGAHELLRHEVALRLPNEELHVLGDETRLSQIVSNLLTNAAKYTPDGGSIDVTLSREGDDALLEVADNGIGIAPDMLPRIFDMFVQVDRQAARNDGGLGIGLAVVSRLVAQHHGSVVARSAGLGRGSSFTVRLPAV